MVVALCKRGRNAFSRSIPGIEEVGKEKVCEGMSISVEVASARGVGESCGRGEKKWSRRSLRDFRHRRG